LTLKTAVWYISNAGPVADESITVAVQLLAPSPGWSFALAAKWCVVGEKGPALKIASQTDPEVQLS